MRESSCLEFSDEYLHYINQLRLELSHRILDKAINFKWTFVGDRINSIVKKMERKTGKNYALPFNVCFQMDRKMTDN